jgi:hypothetical protein
VTPAEEAALVARQVRQRVAWRRFQAEQRRQRQERQRLFDAWFWDDPGQAETARRLANALDRLPEAVSFAFGGDPPTPCQHLAEVLADGDVWDDSTPAAVCRQQHPGPPRLFCPAGAQWHSGAHRPERSTCDGCGDRAQEWRWVPLLLRGVWVVPEVRLTAPTTTTPANRSGFVVAKTPTGGPGRCVTTEPGPGQPQGGCRARKHPTRPLRRTNPSRRHDPNRHHRTAGRHPAVAVLVADLVDLACWLLLNRAGLERDDARAVLAALWEPR